MSALHSCVEFIQMTKIIDRLRQPCTPLITCKLLCVIRPFSYRLFLLLLMESKVNTPLYMIQPHTQTFLRKEAMDGCQSGL